MMNESQIQIFLFCFFITIVVGDISCKMEPKCSIGKTHGMKSADCYRKDLRWFPQCLASGVEIIDLSENRLRKINGNDLNKYTSLKMLYLSDNMIQSLDENSFTYNDDLTTLDLSLNAISKLPKVIFNLPSLKTLYLRQNINMNLAEIVEEAKPITSPLIHLDISYAYEEPNALPDLGIMPYLRKYNISGNVLSSLGAFHFAGLCDLQILVTNNVTAFYTTPCECHVINRWLTSRKVQFILFPCGIPESECVEKVGVADLLIFSKCEAVQAAESRTSLATKIAIGISVPLGVIIVLGITIYFIRKRKRKHTHKQVSNIYDATEMLSPYK